MLSKIWRVTNNIPLISIVVETLPLRTRSMKNYLFPYLLIFHAIFGYIFFQFLLFSIEFKFFLLEQTKIILTHGNTFPNDFDRHQFNHEKKWRKPRN